MAKLRDWPDIYPQLPRVIIKTQEERVTALTIDQLRRSVDSLLDRFDDGDEVAALGALYRAIGELGQRRWQVEVAQEVTRRCLDMDTDIPEGAEGRDKAFRLLETWSGNLQFIARL